jgi:hypothetical protein
MRLSGEPDDIAAVLAALRQQLDIAGGDKTYANRGGFGVRAYLEARPRALSPVTVRADRLDAAVATRPDGSPTVSPLAAADQAKRRRDLDAEIGILTATDQHLKAQPWYPIQPGDVVCWSIDAPDGARHGETLVAVDDPTYPTLTGAPLKKVSETPYEATSEDQQDGQCLDCDGQLDVGGGCPECDHEENDGPAPEQANYEDFYDIWFEAGPSTVAVIRHGQLVHGSMPNRQAHGGSR